MRRVTFAVFLSLLLVVGLNFAAQSVVLAETAKETKKEMKKETKKKKAMKQASAEKK